MTSLYVHQEIIKKLYNEYKIRGYVTEKSVFDAVDSHNLPLEEVDNICDRLLSKGVIIHDVSGEKSDDDEDVYDRSQIDYEKLFYEVLAIDKSLSFFINEVRQIKPPQHRECQNLIPQAKNGNLFARQRIIEMYLRTAVKVALWHHQKFKIPLAEAIQDACVGLVIALDKYDVSRQDKFSTYAPWWMRQNIMRNAPSLNPLIFVPVHIKDKLFGIYNILEKLYYNRNDRNTIYQEMQKAVMEKLDCSENEANEYANCLIPFENIDELLKNEESAFSDRYVGEEKIFNDIKKEEFKNSVVEALETLKPGEKKVILFRFGFLDEKEWTLEDIGHELGVTRERIRQIEEKALKRLRYYKRSKNLK